MLPVGAPGIFSDFFKVCLDAKESVVCGKQREATAPSVPGKTTVLVSEFAVEDLLSNRTAA